MAIVLEVSSSDLYIMDFALIPNGQLDGDVTWSVVSGPGTIETDAGGLKISLVSPDNVTGPVDTVYRASADIDLGAGTELHEEDVVHHVSPHGATSFGIQAAVPRLKNPPTP